MKNSRKIVSLLLVLAMVLGVALTGCSKQETALAQPDEVAVALFKLVMQDDASAAKDALGYETEEAARADFLGEDGDIYGELAEEIIGQFESALGVTAKEEDAQKFLDSFLTMMGKLNFTASVKEMDEKARTAVVTCDVSTLDMNAFNNSIENTLTDLLTNSPELANDRDALVSAIILAMADALEGMEPSAETSSFDVDFSLEIVETNGKPQRVWVPADAEAFGEAISNAAMGN